MWDTSTGQCLRTLVHEDNPAVTNVCFSPSGRFVLAFSLDNSIRLWDYVSGAVKKTYQGHKNHGFSIGGCFGLLKQAREEGGATGISFDHSRDLAFVASASEDGDIVLWDVKTKEIVQRIRSAHKGVCFWVDVNGSTMVSAGQDGMIQVFKDNNALASGWCGGEGRDGKVNGNLNGANGVHKVNGYRGDEDGSISPDAELQRKIEQDASSPLRQVKEEQL